MTTDLYADLVARNDENFFSNSIEAVGYDRINSRLFVEFQSGPAVYAYDDVHESTFNLFIGAKSLNQFWREHIAKAGNSTKYDFAYINERESEEEVDLQPETKWLTGEDSPVLTESEADASAIHLSGTLNVGALTFSPVQPERYGVKYDMTATDQFGNDVVTAMSGPFEPEFQALSEADALVQFENAKRQMESITGWTIQAKVMAVTHYFD